MDVFSCFLLVKYEKILVYFLSGLKKLILLAHATKYLCYYYLIVIKFQINLNYTQFQVAYDRILGQNSINPLKLLVVWNSPSLLSLGQWKISFKNCFNFT